MQGIQLAKIPRAAVVIAAPAAPARPGTTGAGADFTGKHCLSPPGAAIRPGGGGPKSVILNNREDRSGNCAGACQRGSAVDTTCREPSTQARAGRAARGRVAKGDPGGAGKPFARR